MKKSPKINNVLEVFWLIISVLTGIMGIYSFFKVGFQSAYPFFIMSILSILLYLARKSLRLKNSK